MSQVGRATTWDKMAARAVPCSSQEGVASAPQVLMGEGEPDTDDQFFYGSQPIKVKFSSCSGQVTAATAVI